MADQFPIPIYAISLADSTVRREALSAAMDDLGLAFRFIDAIDGRNGLPAEFRDRYNETATLRRLGRTLSTAEIAASLSHGLAYARIIDEGHAHALILEDDAMVGPGLPRFLAAKGHEAAPMILVHHLNARVLPGAKATVAGDILVRELALPCFRAAAYTVSREAAEYLLDAGSPVTTPPDWPGDITLIGAGVTLPQLVDHPPQDSAQSILAATGRTRDRAPLSRVFSLPYLRRMWRKMRSERVS